MSELRNLTRVRISGPPGVQVGRIEDIRTPAECPNMPGFDAEGEWSPREIMRRWGVTRVAIISYGMFAFTALEIGGEWYDMKRQHLTLEIIGQYQ